MPGKRRRRRREPESNGTLSCALLSRQAALHSAITLQGRKGEHTMPNLSIALLSRQAQRLAGYPSMAEDDGVEPPCRSTPGVFKAPCAHARHPR